jgi:hypothetical protein
MKRRNFNLLAGTSMAALMGPRLKAFAQSVPSDFATLSQTTLTPYGAERAGNAAGTIPAWTGGFTTIQAGWDPDSELPPDFFASDGLLYTVDASNLAQYAHLLSDGVQTLIQKQGFSLQVYPAHRTAAAPQWVYDNIAQNATRAALDPAGGRLGFSGGYGGIPFPIPDTSDPLAAGAQIMWNHTARWQGTYLSNAQGGWVVLDGSSVCSNMSTDCYYYPYYDPKGSVADFNGYIYYFNTTATYPANVAGEVVVVHQSVNPVNPPNITWQLQLGLGRVRKAPELAYDTPSSYSNGLSNFDEIYGFYGALDEYDWKYIGKREMLVPYNNNKVGHTTIEDLIGPKFPNPDIVRWELHRVWVVEATLHPGRRNVLARRRVYVDEDTWQVKIHDGWDGNGNIFHHTMTYNLVYPNLPGVLYMDAIVFNMQTGGYATLGGPHAAAPLNAPFKFDPIPVAVFQPQTMAANSTY